MPAMVSTPDGSRPVGARVKQRLDARVVFFCAIAVLRGRKSRIIPSIYLSALPGRVSIRNTKARLRRLLRGPNTGVDRMYLIVLAMGVVTALAGALMIGFGIPINEFGIGNTLISAGTTAVVGGFVLIALAATLRQLRTVAEATQGRGWPAATADGRSPNPYPSARVAAPGPIAAPPTSPGPPAERGTGLEPARGDYGLRPRFTARPPPNERGDRGPLHKEEEAYSSSRDHDREAEEEGPFVSARGANARGERAGGFDAIWPAAASEAKSLPSASHDETEAPDRDRDHDERVETTTSSILKSGVIDGMVYTLYTDGSIEAELPQGTLKFASIDELRDYLLNKE
jgi:hypothetical protein